MRKEIKVKQTLQELIGTIATGTREFATVYKARCLDGS